MTAIGGKAERFVASRRDFLVRALSTGLFAGGAGWNMEAYAQLFGQRPKKLPPNRSIFEMRGNVLVNGKPASLDQVIVATDRLETADGAYLVGAVGDTAFLMRENTTLHLDGTRLLVRAMRLVQGGLLSVFGHRGDEEQARLSTVVATVGIRGTGVYAKTSGDDTYLCTCYGTTELAAADDPSASEQIVSKHHDAPRFILAKPDGGKRIVPAPFMNHTDLELMTIEAIVGREVPFGVSGNEYDGPRRDY